jgi:hypothetical protein
VIQNDITSEIRLFLMVSIEEENKIAFITCIEVVLMRRGDTNYNLVLAKLQSLYNCWILQCIDNPEYLRTVLKEVYVNDYYTVVDEIRSESDRLSDIDELKSDFFKVMLS